jgi:murein DD-endopeptidase MepM/ murein hydrolase activator NlpD
MPSARPRRIICHWTASGYKASSLDRKHYHFLIEDDGTIVQGTNTIADNDSTSDGKYAAHTLGSNTKSIGLAVCCMSGATKTNPGRFPMTEVQWRRMAELAAELCRHYKIDVTPQTVLGHFEVERILGVRQRGKWDPGFLPWDTNATQTEVGSRFRSMVTAFLSGDQEPDDTQGAEIGVSLQGKALKGAVSMNEEVMIPVKTLVDDLKWTLPYANETHAVLDPGEDKTPIYCAFQFMEDGLAVNEADGEDKVIAQIVAKGYVSADQLAQEMDLPTEFDDTSDMLAIGEKPKRTRARPGEPKFKQVVVRRGDTLSRIAAIHLSNGDQWTKLLKQDGTPFTQNDARRLQVGQVVLVPVIADTQPAPAPGDLATEPPPDLKASGINLDLLVDAAQPGFRRFAMESIPVILAECISSGVMMPAQVAYVLATSEHESGCGKWMKELWGPTPTQRTYEGRSDLGNNQRGDGLRFRGRGYVQITGRRNYTIWARRLGIDILSLPDLVATDPSIAAKILVQGMRDGSFTGKKLADYIRPDQEPDFFNARAMINGDKRKNGEKIAGHARNYLAALTRPTDPD